MNYKLSDQYLLLFTDCLLTKGVVNATICDTTRGTIDIIPAAYYELLEELKVYPLSHVYDKYNEGTHEHITDFIRFLLKKEYAILLNDKKFFPEIKREWRSPEKINNAIIDINSLRLDFRSIIEQLDDLNCQVIQLRIYSNLYSLDELSMIINLMRDTSIKGVEILIKYAPEYQEKDYILFFESHILISSLHIHSAPIDKTVGIDFGYKGKSKTALASIKTKIYFIKEQIVDSTKCGEIKKSYFCLNSVSDIMHNSCYNSCLNKKIAIDVNGEIKNCPSMTKSFGNINKDTLQEVYSQSTFKELWNVTKDQIDGCKVCEFRLVCSDCRAFLENPQNKHSKPLKCGYDPYTGKWHEWTSDHLIKRRAMQYYQLKQQ
ncbi:Radical SAM domain protein [Fulvivirga imtechensis AK7]|uniref:Radical SAM domain protein n=1 Tax=Fulvivirga imtechensis AK7 TaxID=1237149 RepID=L8K0Z8_9BACT|nr:grasp-with-spasm system SPASM domain peptide maturase [Fulvivirga imtechensis]ELR73132.1 Radical SAM domain protein [Fulvivirga imtechensis AK7]